MEYQELLDLRFVELDWERHAISTDRDDDDTFRMSLQEFLDRMFWAGEATFDVLDGETVWTSVPASDPYRWSKLGIGMGEDIKFSDGKHEYNMKLVRDDNDTVKVGETVWWETPEWHSGKIPSSWEMDWNHATKVEVTRKGDNDILEVWQVYGEPHGSWEWNLRKLGNPMAINQLRFK